MIKVKLLAKINVLYIHNRPSGGAGESLYQMIYKNNFWNTKAILFLANGFLKEKFEALKPKIIVNYFNGRSWLGAIKNKNWLFWPTKIYHLPATIFFYKRIRTLVREQSVDIIHTNTINIIEGGIVAKNMNVPHFVQIRELLDLEYYNYPISKDWILKILVKYADVLIANSERTKRGLLKFKIKESKIRVIYNAIDTAKKQLNIRQYLELPSNTRIVAIVGWITPNKMIEDFLEIAKHFQDKENTKFVIVGDYGFNQEYNNEIKNTLQKLSNVILTGIIPNATEYMSSFDVLLCTCYTESFGRTVAEALIEGTPAIGVKSCAVSEIIQHEKSGFVVEKSDIAEFVKYTRLLLDDDKLNYSMGLFGKQDVKKRFGVEIIRKQFLELYKEFKK